MKKSESKDTVKRVGRKPKFDYTSEDFLSTVETYAKKGFTDKEIAFALGIEPETFCRLKGGFGQLNQVLARGRATVTAAVRAKFVAMAMGGIKVKSETRRFVQERCACMGKMKKCPECGGTGWITLTNKSVIQETISELPPSLQAQSVILYHYDPEWKSVERKQDEDATDIPTDIEKGIDIDSWIKDKVK